VALGRPGGIQQKLSSWQLFSLKERLNDRSRARCTRGKQLAGVTQEAQTALSTQTGSQSMKDKTMTVARITEISSVSDKSFQDAIVQGVERANMTLKNVKGAWVKDQEVTIDNGKVTGYKVVLKVTFILSD
jgi:flavin-binding protein dodecin